MKPFKHRSSSSSSAAQAKLPPDKGADLLLASSPNTITLRPSVSGGGSSSNNNVPNLSSVSAPVYTNAIDRRSLRYRSVSDGGRHDSHQHGMTYHPGSSHNHTNATTSRQSPLDPTILSVLGEEDDGTTTTTAAAEATTTTTTGASSLSSSTLEPPPSPGTPPKKLWERQFGSFLLRNRVRSGGNLISTTPTSAASGDTTLADVAVVAAAAAASSSSPSLRHDGSVRGGKFFTHVFRSSSSTTTTNNAPTDPHSQLSVAMKSRRASSSSGSCDELDGTKRRGAVKAYYSPRNVALHKQQALTTTNVVTSVAIPNHGNNNNNSTSKSPTSNSSSYGSNSTATTSTNNNSNNSCYLRPRIAVREDVSLHTALSMQQQQQHAAVGDGDGFSITTDYGHLLPGPPLFLPPRAFMPVSSSSPQQQQKQEQQRAMLNSFMQEINATTTATPSILGEPMGAPIVVSAIKSSTAMKKAFTEIRNATEDADSAYLGDDPSFSGRNLFFAQKNERLAEFNTSISKMTGSKSYNQISRHFRSSSTAAGSFGHSSPLDTVEETVVINSRRTLKPIAGVEAWQTGRRYLIAPAALAACPDSAVAWLFGNSCSANSTPITEHASTSNAVSAVDAVTNPLFGMIVLGECLLSYVTPSSSTMTRTANHWSSAQLVLRQNYLLEYDVGVDVRTTIPRGYAHLQFATTRLHEHFCDALALHFYGSPCAKADARVLMIRVVLNNSSYSNLDDSVHWHPEIRLAWQQCLNRAAALTEISDLYDYDTTNLLGKGQYAEVRAARRRRPVTMEEAEAAGVTTTSTIEKATKLAQQLAAPGYDCALKIFDKDKFWRMVVKGRERADTIVRETSVQATLLARCGKNPSFLRVFGFFETSSKVVLELELLEGTDLFQYISSQNVLKEAEAAMILRDVLRCLDVMSKIGVAHRDVKPANILMCGKSNSKNNGGNDEASYTPPSTSRVKVGDFGMAAFVGVDGQVRGRCGTPGYVAPEIFSAGIYGGYGNKVDVFSAGVTLYVMLCGYEPFYGETDAELKEANKAAAVDFPPEDWANVSADSIDLVKQMMHPDPVKRLDARQALQHRWFQKNLILDEDATVDHDLALMSPSTRRDDACILS